MEKKVFAIGLLSYILTACMVTQNSDSVVLRAYASHSKEPVWEVSLISNPEKQCSVVVKKDDPNIQKSYSPSSEECENFHTLSRNMYASNDSAEVFVPVIDEPIYEFHLREHIRRVNLESPEECEILKSGELLCEINQISPAQELLLKLKLFVH